MIPWPPLKYPRSPERTLRANNRKRTLVRLSVISVIILLLLGAGYVGLIVLGHFDIITDHPLNAERKDSAGGFGAYLYTPQWSPRGDYIVFAHWKSIYMVESDGTGLRRIDGSSRFLDHALLPSVSPDGSHIVYADLRHFGWWPLLIEHQWEIVTRALHGSDKRRLTNTDDSFILNLHPVWSPDGARIAFLSDRLAYESRSDGIYATELDIYVMAADGSDVRRLTTGIRAWPWPAAWSPDGRRLAFVAMEAAPSHEVLYTVGADGSRLIRIGETGTQPTWSPDGSRVAFALADGIYAAALNGSNLVKIVKLFEFDTSYYSYLRWSPDGASFLLSGNSRVSVINIDGSGHRRFLELPYKSNAYASWSPDGSRIVVYSSSRDNELDVALFTIRADGSGKRILVKYREEGSLSLGDR